MTISNVSITRQSYTVETPTSIGKAVGKRYLWDVEYTKDGVVEHALFTTEEEALRYANAWLGYTG